jgi:hypothetical protein
VSTDETRPAMDADDAGTAPRAADATAGAGAPTQARVPDQERDLALMRRFEPIVHYTRGELFFPMSAVPYIARCELWAGTSERDSTLLVPLGELTAESLPTYAGASPGKRQFLRFVQHPLSGADLTRWHRRPGRPRFSAPSRLARVGIVARLIDAGFDLSLLVRGKVPGGTMAAAEVKYAEIRAKDPRFIYHGRVVRQAGWTVCHYMFFYAANDWRSTFAGANDHEADLEQCFVFVEERADGEAVPVWFGRAAHDEVGPDLRRRWDDTYLQREGDHPVIFAGAGSHAAYIERGEYLLSVPLKLPPIVGTLGAALRRFWAETLRQGTEGRSGSAGAPIGSVPFVDYARGDGVAVGPGQPNGWTPIVIGDDTPWVDRYRGLFGLDTYDRFAGERAPAGPKYARDGRPRQSWIDPVGFVALDATPPPGRAAEVLGARIASLESERMAAAVARDDLATRAQELGTQVQSLQRAGRSQAFIDAVAAERDAAITDLTAARAKAEVLRETIAEARDEIVRLEAGDAGDPRSHLRMVARPQSQRDIRRSRILDFWSAIGVGLAVFLIGFVLFIEPAWIVPTLLAVVIGYVAIETIIRRRVLTTLLDLTLILAGIALLLLAVQNYVVVIAFAILAVGIVILRDNIRELRSSIG